MADPFIGEISLFAFNKIPVGWHACDGSTLTVQSNQALYALLGKQFGGDGVNTFALPDLRGRTPLGWNWRSAVVQGTTGGTETVVLGPTQVPPHTHNVNVSTAVGTLPQPLGHVLSAMGSGASVPAFPAYAPGTNTSTMVPLASATVGITGGGGGHENRQPSLALAYCIATTGIWPTRP